MSMQALIEREYSESQLSSIERKLYMLLMENDAMTIRQIADMLSINSTETYYLLRAMQDKKLVMAVPKVPVRFTALPSANFVLHKTSQRVRGERLQYCYTAGNTQVCLNIDKIISKILDEVSFLQAHVINLEERIDKIENDMLQERLCKICSIELNVDNACKDTQSVDICNECWIKFNIR